MNPTTTTHHPEAVGQVYLIPMDLIDAGNNDRKLFNREELQQLADSIALTGLIQPILVVPTDGGRYRLVAGERRFRAHQLIEAATIKAMVSTELDAAGESDRMLGENGPRVQLDPIAEAEAFQKRLDEGQTVEHIATVYGCRPAQVRWRLDLLRLDPVIYTMVRTGRIPPSVAWKLSDLNHAHQREAVRVISEQELGAGAAADLVGRLKAVQDQQDLFDTSAFQMAVEEFTLDTERAAARATRAGLVDLLRQCLAALPDSPLADKVTAALESETTIR